MKQTAVEWLIEQFKDYDCTPSSNNEEYVIVMPKWIFNAKKDEAKQMDKVEKEYFFNCGRQYQLTGEGTFTEVHNETFNTHNRLETIFGKIEKSEWQEVAEKRQSEKTKLGRSTKTSWSD